MSTDGLGRKPRISKIADEWWIRCDATHSYRTRYSFSRASWADALQECRKHMHQEHGPTASWLPTRTFTISKAQLDENPIGVSMSVAWMQLLIKGPDAQEDA